MPTSLSTLTRELSVELLLSLDTGPMAETKPETPAPWVPAAVEALVAFRDHR